MVLIALYTSKDVREALYLKHIEYLWLDKYPDNYSFTPNLKVDKINQAYFPISTKIICSLACCNLELLVHWMAALCHSNIPKDIDYC